MIKILIVDDNESIHHDFKKVLTGRAKNKLKSVEMALFGEDDADLQVDEPVMDYKVEDAFQGQEAVEMVDSAAASDDPYTLIFMDVRMPPGMDGVEAVSRIWRKHPEIEVVICTAHSDYSWGEIVKEIGESDKLQFLRKPFDMVTVQQLALATMKKREAAQEKARELARLKVENQGAREAQEKVRQLAMEVGAKLDKCQQTARELGERVTRGKAEIADGNSAAAQQFVTDAGQLSQNIANGLGETKTSLDNLKGAVH
jgi:CheY-like chemotaxis protein